MFELWVFFEDKWQHVYNGGEYLTYSNYQSAVRAARSWSSAFPTNQYRVLDVEWDETQTFLNGKLLGHVEAETREEIRDEPLEEWERELLNVFEPGRDVDAWYESGHATAEYPSEPLAFWERELLGMPTAVKLSNGQVYSLNDFGN